MSRHLPALRPAKVLKALQRAGFYIHHTKGSHHFLKHPDRPGVRVTLAMHNDDLKRKTLASIIEQAGYTTEEFLELLGQSPNSEDYRRYSSPCRPVVHSACWGMAMTTGQEPLPELKPMP
jgi:predicted RNA binding protein YcfA (HicA-like mRNA interferase family)